MRWSITSTMQSCIDTRMMSLSRRCKELCGMSRHSRMETWKGETSWWTWKGSAITSASSSATKVRLVISTLVMHDELAQERKAGVQSLADDLRSSSWTAVRYKYNRGVVFDGDLPHLATKIERLDSSKRRVILSAVRLANAIPAPEHSDAFNRTIKLYQTIGNVNRPAEGTDEADSDRCYEEPRSGQTNRFGCEEG